MPVPNRLEKISVWIADLRLDGIILSGGNDLDFLPNGTNVAPERDATERRILDICAERGLRVLGVCRGAQIMAAHYGCRVTAVDGHVATYHGITVLDPARLALTSRDAVNSFHGFGLDERNLSDELTAVAAASDGTIEAIAHQHHAQAAIMWHPERPPNVPRDGELIRNFFSQQP